MKLATFQILLLVQVQANYRACNEDEPIIDLSAGSQGSIIYSPNYPKSFFSQTQCKWEVKAPMGFRVKIVFLEFYLPQDASGGCENIYLKVLDTNTNLSEDTMGGFQDKGYNICGDGSAPIVSQTGDLVLILHSNTNVLAVKEKNFKIVLKKTLEPSSNLFDGMTIGAGSPHQTAPSPPQQPSFSAQHSYPAQPLYPATQRNPMHHQMQPKQVVGAPVGGHYPPQNLYPPHNSYMSPSANPYDVGGYGAPLAPTGRPMGPPMNRGGGGGFTPKKNGVPTRKDGRVDTTYRDRVKKALLKMAAAGKLPTLSSDNDAAAPSPNGAANPGRMTPGFSPPAAGAAPPPPTGHAGYVPPPPPAPLGAATAPIQSVQPRPANGNAHVKSDNIKVDDAELSTLALIAIGTGVISVVCGITLMLFLYKKRRKPKQDLSYMKYARDHTPVSRHSSFSLEQQRAKNKSVNPPRDFMDKKDVEMVRTLSRAPMTGPDEYYLKSSESKDSGFSAPSRKPSFITSLKS